MNRGRKLSDKRPPKVNGLCDHEEETAFTYPDVGRQTSVNIETSESQECNYANTEIYRQLRPLLLCMRIFGLYFRRTVDSKGRSYMEHIVLLCFIVNFLNVINVLRSFTVYSAADTFDNVLVQKVLFTVWSSECTFKGLLMMSNCYSQNGFPKFFKEWDAVCGNVKLSKVCLFMMKKYICLTLVFIVVNSVVFTLILIYVPVLETIYLDVVWKNATQYENVIVFKITLTFLAVLNSSASMFPVSLFVTLSFAIGKRLQKYTDELENAKADENFLNNLEEYRIRHQSLCKVVAILDSIFSYMLAAVYIANIPMFCLVLYTMVTTMKIHLSLVLINLFWLSFILLQMTIVSVTAAWVNVQVSIVF